MRIGLLILAMAVFGSVWGNGAKFAQQGSRQRAQYLDCRAEWDGGSLLIRNQRIERRWKIQKGLTYNQSLRDLTTGKEKLLAASDAPSPSPEFAVQGEPLSVTVTAEEWQPVVVENISLKVSVKAEYRSYTLITCFKIYPDTPAITSWLEIEGRTPPPAETSSRKDHYGVEDQKSRVEQTTDLNESFQLEHVHRQLGVVTLMDHTDDKDNLAQVAISLLTNPSRDLVSGALFHLEDQFTKEGIIFLKEAPLPYARPVKSRHDLAWSARQFTFTGLGAGGGAPRRSYPFTTILYTGGAGGRIRALHDYQRRFRAYDPRADEKVWHCTWGDRNRDGRVSEAFLSAELSRLIEIGMDHLYFTDGWQKYPSKNSVIPGGIWENQWAQPDYWDANPTRFPNGLEPLVERARAHGVQVGMWHNPDKTNDYANWEKDVGAILTKRRRYGITNVKFDGVAFFTKQGEDNLLKAMHGVAQGSGGKVAIEIDVTTGLRTGYFSAMQYGFLFLENRYTDLRRYYPHCTLRNLWQLAHYVDPRRLRVEFLNNERRRELYPNDPLAPYQYGFDYVFAVTMFANPLAWFEVTGLSERQAQTLKAMLAVNRRHRQRIHEGNIFPVGAEPSGFDWTGFQSQVPGAKDGYLLVFRELNEQPSGTFTLHLLEPGAYRFERLAGQGESFTARIGKGRQVNISLPKTLSFVLYRYEQESN